MPHKEISRIEQGESTPDMSALEHELKESDVVLEKALSEADALYDTNQPVAELRNFRQRVVAFYESLEEGDRHVIH